MSWRLALGQLWSYVPFPTRVPHLIFGPQPTHVVTAIIGPGAWAKTLLGFLQRTSHLQGRWNCELGLLKHHARMTSTSYCNSLPWPGWLELTTFPLALLPMHLTKLYALIACFKGHIFWGKKFPTAKLAASSPKRNTDHSTPN